MSVPWCVCVGGRKVKKRSYKEIYEILSDLLERWNLKLETFSSVEINFVVIESLFREFHFLFNFPCFSDSTSTASGESESTGDHRASRRRPKVHEIKEETQITDSFANELDLSCMSKGLVKAPAIENGSVQKYNRWDEIYVLMCVNFVYVNAVNCGEFKHEISRMSMSLRERINPQFPLNFSISHADDEKARKSSWSHFTSVMKTLSWKTSSRINCIAVMSDGLVICPDVCHLMRKAAARMTRRRMKVRMETTTNQFVEMGRRN